ncbi:MAG: VOC family protein [Jatrophihabitantaceae bacterium]
MSTRETPWPDATPNWVELSTPDFDAARRFYQELFGWTVKDEPTGRSADCYLDGRRVCGISCGAEQLDGGHWGGGQPSAWISYFAASDAAAVLGRVHRAGGWIQAGPVPDGDRCIRAVATDPLGAVFGLWQAGSHFGAEWVNEPGTLVWNEHLSLDYLAPQPFYAEAFGWQYRDISVGEFRYATCRAADEREVGGIGEPPADLPVLAGRWLVYFAAADTDAVVDRLLRLGGGVVLPAIDTPHGRLAVVRDDQAAVFALLGPSKAGSDGS